MRHGKRRIFGPIALLSGIVGSVLFAGHTIPAFRADGDIAPAGRCGQTSPAPAAEPDKNYEAISLFGGKLASPAPDAAALERVEKAKREHAAAQTENSFINLGRALVSAGRFRDAIVVFTEGLKQFPKSFLLYRHRGHRYISIRQFNRAVADLEKAAALIKDLPVRKSNAGAPLDPGTVTPEIHFAVYYHYALAAYFSRDYAKAESLCRECLKMAQDGDSTVAIVNWLYITMRQNGKAAEAARLLTPINRGMKADGEREYLERALMFKGEVSEADYATSGDEGSIRDYGLGLVNLWRGDKASAKTYFKRLIQERSWPAFAAIATEIELADLAKADPDRTSVASMMDAWALSWNIYDLDLSKKLFLAAPQATYFSSEKAGRIEGYDALMEHHRGFGFVPGGKTADSRLWLEDTVIREQQNMAYVTAKWHFDRDPAAPGPAQQGPVTFVLSRGEDGWRIVHAHFANDPAPPKK